MVRKSREEFIKDGLRTWRLDACAMNVMCDVEEAHNAMVVILNKKYDKLIENDRIK